LSRSLSPSSDQINTKRRIHLCILTYVEIYCIRPTAAIYSMTICLIQNINLKGVNYYGFFMGENVPGAPELNYVLCTR
jgi:hypothetical protein